MIGPVLVTLALNAFAASTAPFPDDAVVAAISRAMALEHERRFCLKIDRKDPSETLLRALREIFPKASPGTECTWNRAKDFTEHVPTGEAASIISLDAFVLTASDTATARMASSGGILSAAESTLSFEKLDGRWVVARMTLRWIS